MTTSAGQDSEGDEPFEHGVEKEGARGTIRSPSQPPRAQAQATHEDGEHGRRGRRRRPEDEAESPRPRDLVGERAEAGEEEEGRHDEERNARGSSSGDV